MCAGLDRGLGLGVAVKAAEDEFYLGLDLGEGGFGLLQGEGELRQLWNVKDRVGVDGG